MGFCPETNGELSRRTFQTYHAACATIVKKSGWKAIILLATNCVFGQTDLSNLPLRGVDVKSGWLEFARVKMAVPRRIPLWLETIAVIRDWLPVQPAAKNPDDAGLLFLTQRGQPRVKVNHSGSPADAPSQNSSG